MTQKTTPKHTSMSSLHNLSDHELHHYYTQLRTLDAQVRALENARMTKLDMGGGSGILSTFKDAAKSATRSKLQNMQDQLTKEFPEKLTFDLQNDKLTVAVKIPGSSGTQKNIQEFKIIQTKEHFMVADESPQNPKELIIKSEYSDYGTALNAAKARIKEMLGESTFPKTASAYPVDISKYSSILCTQYKRV